MVPVYYIIVALPCTLGAIALAIFHIYWHLMNYTEPTYQRYIVRIIFMVPVSVTPFLGTSTSVLMVSGIIPFQFAPIILSMTFIQHKLHFSIKINKALASVASRLKLRRAARLTALKGFASPRLASPHPLEKMSTEKLFLCYKGGGIWHFSTLKYEAWVIYNFLSLCLAWVGGPGAVVLSLTGRVLKPSFFLMTCCFPPIPLDG
ncbi:hypothetical protein Cgig2_006843 [Carnegiea gigantea]|uniref:Uncharacterized protein n=1 Tax=Carnegiea gigantea TaxID=171969 RepID=A0A9Q1GL91_9CARY|nr:hypothetical protein Cgig2_006843 [Carnegiea gigantea]